MRWAWFAMMLWLMTGCASQRPSVARDTQLARARRSIPRQDPLTAPRAQADPEVKRLTALREALRTQLRSTEDQLLIVVVKSADYDEEASRQLGELQQRRLLISIALRDIEQQRRRRAEDVIHGWVGPDLPPPPPADAGKEDEEQGLDKTKEKAQRDAQSSAVEALLARAKLRLERARLADRRYPSRFSQSLSLGMGMAAAPKSDSSAARRGRGAWREDKKMPTQAAAEAANEAASDSAADGWDEEPPKKGEGKLDQPPPGTGAIQAAAVVTAGAPPDLSAALRPLLPRMQACIPKERLSQGLAFTVRARLGTDGSVRGARLSGGHGLSPRAAACVVDVMRQVRLPKGGGGRIVSVPLRMSAR